MQPVYRVFIWLFVTAFCLLYVYIFISLGGYQLHHDPKAMDFLAFYTGGQQVLLSPANLYSLRIQHSLQQHIDPITQTNGVFLPFLNPPFVAFFFKVFVSLSVLDAYFVFLITNIILLVAMCFVFLQQNKNKKWYYLLAFILGSATFVPLLITLLVGQLSIILCAIVIFSWLFLKKGWELRSGLILALILIKPQFFLLPFLAILIQRRGRQVTGFIIGTFVLIGASYISIGYTEMNNYFSLLSSFFTFGSGYNINLMAQQSLQTLLLLILHTHSLTQIRLWWVLISLFIAIPTLYVWSKKFPLVSPYLSLQYALLIAATLLISPHTHFYDVSMLFTVTIFLLTAVNKFKKEQRRLIIILSVLNYFIPLVGYCLFVWSQNETQGVWTIPSSVYLIFLWLILLRVNLQGNKSVKNAVGNR